MASSENLASFEPFFFRHTFPDSWISEAYARDTDALTKALQKSLSNNNNNNNNSLLEVLTSDSLINPFLNLSNSESNASPITTPTASNVSGSEPETPSAPPPKRQRNGIPAATGKFSKRKSRASKRSQTTFISADPANFRQMVQQVTGVRLDNSQFPVVPVLKPEPQRPGSRLRGAPGGLPTLDTSAFLLDHHHHQQQQQMVGGATSSSGPIVGRDPVSFSQAVLADGGPSAGLEFDTFSSFPTLESGKVM
ncbi:calmodulin-binding protein 25 [Ricinus communis]|uniref:VQ domain-containing protein n=1 Tax=Ricinus communis TaxID=3988 RepID=B9S4W4_RICCO|nr:calmodulin-binding protein 25 [Ricinus communis]EEF41317.1 conserved hypothetical protein [Ricinus communis]|eukprot:XP_002521033.1 calmodulin-binding protein 25 [Ricinus communis]